MSLLDEPKLLEVPWIPLYRPWPVAKCGVLGCEDPRAVDEEPGHTGLLRRWCRIHAGRWDWEARRQGGAKVIQLKEDSNVYSSGHKDGLR